MDGAPKYVPGTGKQATIARLSSLATANVPSACPVYVGLAAPSDRSPQHAKATHAVAEALATGNTGAFPVFSTSPSPALRALTAASWRRIDAVVAELDSFPADLATALWWQVTDMLDAASSLSAAEVCLACNLLTRLGYQAKAASLLSSVSSWEDKNQFDTRLVRAQFSALYYGGGDAAELETRALAAADDRRLSARDRLEMAIFVTVANGKRGKETQAMRQAAALAEANLAELEASSFEWHLASHKCFRAISYLPFVQRDAAGTLHRLNQAENSLKSAVPGKLLEEIAWRDFAVAMYETLTKTSISLGNSEQALAASEQLIKADSYEHRTWDARGRALSGAGRFEEALNAYANSISIGGHPAGEAAYHIGWIHEQTGDFARAREAYNFSLRVDPTVQVVRDRAEALK